MRCTPDDLPFSFQARTGVLRSAEQPGSAAYVYLLIWGSRSGGWGQQESHCRENECLAEGCVCKCVLWGIVHARLCPFLCVRVSLSVSFSSRCRLFPWLTT